MSDLTSFRVDKYEVYDKDEADAAIAELEADLAAERRRGQPHDAGCECPDCDPAYDHCDLQDLL